ncbi:hypothetical protein [Acinetobacter haemolyticus]|uniref:Uncharacterized protein n=1 Tax=Acinetobacter haemolyticus TaxID=29430 RepID=A0A845PMQ1_ACIHA|nr:hypothetical protein [Acinetobacter haemolyticus]NAR57652.1 hypothetical protein [Acinetobacter haemolyticus]NAR89470.1 hypothetical protein [Acinetobacter haemolyticus]NAR95645.1 hypothetical protein [Acinetobacter haemolyticus]NAS09911.1 hypothetical protein [Acinetobacter haemolyticus]QHI08893.1 hypothetical protein AhaeAN59_01550 [Acinetobacter haemolyticus]
MNDVELKTEILSNSEKDKYLNINDCIEQLKISKSDFADLIIQNSLEPKFHWSGYLETQMTISLLEYTRLFDSKKLDICSLEEFEDISESTEKVILDGYVNFEGYISIKRAEYFVVELLKSGESKKLSIKDMRIAVNFTRDSVVTLINHKQTLSKEAEYGRKELNNNEIYTIYSGSPNQELKVEDCKFLREDVYQIIENNKEIEIELEDNKKNKSYNGKELFEMIVPIAIRYIRERNQIKDKPQQDDGVGGLKKAVEGYLNGDESLKFLTRNFKKNWQTVINEKKEGQGKSILDKIFEEDIGNTKV